MTGVDNQLYNEVTKLQADALSAMGKCRDKLAGGTAAAALTLWFGDASPAFAKEMKEKVAKMRSVLNSQDIKCKSTTKTIVTPLQGTVLGGKANENAMAVHYNGGIFGQNNTVTRMTETQTFIQISPNFLNLPTTAQGVAATWNGQDKLETLLHELSHYVFRSQKTSCWTTGQMPTKRRMRVCWRYRVRHEQSRTPRTGLFLLKTWEADRPDLPSNIASGKPALPP